MGASCVSVSDKEEKEEYRFIPPAPTTSYLSTHQWKNKIEEARINHGVSSIYNIATVDEYQLFINYLIYFKLPSSFYIAIITRIIRHFVGDILSELLIAFNEEHQNGCSFDGIRITMTTHPITGNIYFADDNKIYTIMETNQLQVIAKLPEHQKQLNNITDLSFTSDGNVLICMLNGNINDIYFIDYNNEHKKLDEKVIYYHIYDTMDIVKYDLSNYYLKSLWFEKCLKGLIGTQISKSETFSCVERSSNGSSTLYTMNSYTNDLWILQNKNYLHKTEPVLFRIPFHVANRLKHYSSEIEMIKLCDLCELNNRYYGGNNYILAFDVDKYYGAIYFITSDYMLYRIEKSKNGSNDKYYEYYCDCKVIVTHNWKVTHVVSLRDVLSHGLPLGLYTIKYDSVTGRIIIADNYKIQTLYI